MESAECFAKRLLSERGIKLVIECKKAVDASVIPDVPDDAGKLSVKLLYVGASGGSVPDPFTHENDRHTCRAVGSPCASMPEGHSIYGLYRTPEGDLWMCWYSKLYIKDPSIYENGLELRFFVPDAVAARAPEFMVSCNGEEVFSTQLDCPGEKSFRIDVRQVDGELRDYLCTVHRHQEQLLKEIARVCNKYGLRYYVCYGTLLGAIRGGEIIPWDDDVDICMPRRDFDILMEKSREEWPEGSDFSLLRPDGYGKDYFLDFMTRLVYMKETETADPFSRLPEGMPWHGHLPLDIYTLDFAEDDEKKQLHRAAKLRLLYALGLSRRKGFSEKGHESLGSLALFGSRILRTAGKALSLGTIKKWYEKTVRGSGRESKYYYMSNGYYLCFGHRYPVSFYEGQRLVRLGDLEVPVPPMAEDLLKALYSDYPEYPHLWQRRPGHYPGRDDYSDFEVLTVFR